MREAKIQYYRDRRGKWRWRFVAGNGEIVAVSSQGYVRKADAIAGLDLLEEHLAPEPEYRRSR